MNIYLSENMLARVFWEQLDLTSAQQDAETDARSIVSFSALIAERFPNKTGSISAEGARVLWLLARYFSPRVIVEIGTYIGRSTSSLYLGAKSTLEHLYTCDATFDAWSSDHLEADGTIEYFGKTTSTQMLFELSSRDVKADLFFIDGRLQEEDLELLSAVATENSVFVLDDFEGLEKGVANGLLLKKQFSNLITIEPPARAHFGKADPHRFGLMFPSSNILLTAQRTRPHVLD